ncbi:MAG: hypothetical protein JWR09_2605 [Mucilaginibacter sp.]|nr:hypothetical protein [Mucilaginibacter sp.]
MDNHVLHKFVLAFTYLLGYGTSSILIGSLGSILIFKGLIKTDFKVPYHLNLFILLAAILLHISGVLAWNTIIYVFPMLIMIVIILNLKNSCALSKLLNTKLFIRIGIMSYSVYIWQQLFSYDQPWKNAFAGSNSLILNFITLVVVSALSYYLYEKRFLLFKKHLKRS